MIWRWWMTLLVIFAVLFLIGCIPVGVDELTLHVVFGSDDPARAAMDFGRAWAVIGALTPAIDRLFVIKKRDICPILDYTIDKMIVDAHLVLTITIGRALALGLKAGAGFLKLLNDSKKGGVQT